MTDPAQRTIAAWENEPFGAFVERQPPMNDPVHRPVPDLDPPGLPVGILGNRPAPDVYELGTDDFVRKSRTTSPPRAGITALNP